VKSNEMRVRGLHPLQAEDNKSLKKSNQKRN